jgi:[acyl-carrier-protein] S-malonyltransferase
MRRRAVLVCPGRGTYNRSELAYLKARRSDCGALLQAFDTQREDAGQVTITALDEAERFSVDLHGRSENASALIYACSIADALAIDRDRFDLVAVTGNSMGWYTALACAGALTLETGFQLVNGMGRLMSEHGVGGQLVYPVSAPDWIPDAQRKQDIVDRVEEIDARADCSLAVSIDLGAMLVLAGDDAGLRAFEAMVPRIADRFPLRLRHHAAFHTHLLAPVAALARQQLGTLPFADATLPLIDGRGAIWYPGCYETDALRDYTLGHQVTRTYDFSAAVRIAAREFAPELFIVAGPGATLADSVAQCLIAAGWADLASRDDFAARQARAPLVQAMGEQQNRSAASDPFLGDPGT